MLKSAARGVTHRDAAPLILLAAAAAFLHAPVLFGRETYFTNDLTMVSFPWRVLTAEQLQKGQVPLWNPYSCFGIPLLGNMQTGIFYPISILFHVFPFSAALGPFLLVSHILAAVWTYLWLKSWGFVRAACFAGAAAFSLGGFLVGALQFPNFQASVAQLPGLVLLAGTGMPLALLSAAAFLAGYPLAWGFMAAFTVILGWIASDRTGASRTWTAARTAAWLCAGLAVGGAALAPGIEYAALSDRTQELPIEQRVNNSVKPGQLAALIRPDLARRLDTLRQTPSPAREDIVWRRGETLKRFTFFSEYRDDYRDPSGARFTPWVSFYAGVAASLLALAGFWGLSREQPRKAALLCLAVACVVLLILGGTTGPSLWLWKTLPPLRAIRGPARFTFLLLAALIPLIAIGCEVLRGRPRTANRSALAGLAAAAVAVELALAGRGFYPTMPRDYYTEAGKLVGFLQESLGNARYFQKPETEAWAYVDRDDPSADYRLFREEVYRTHKQKLFGVSNAVFHLPAGSGGFESMLPRSSRSAMSALQDAPAPALARLLPWAGVRYWLARREEQGAPLIYRGERLWHVYEAARAVSTAYWLAQDRKDVLERGFVAAPEQEGRAWDSLRAREDVVRVWGKAEQAGLIYIAEPYYPGWEATVNGRKTAIRRALDAFSWVAVPSGQVEVALRYRPWSWTIGCCLSIAMLVVFATRALRDGGKGYNLGE